jgi:hypothetical protein
MIWESAIARPLDAVRRELWRLGARTALGRACLRDRGLRLEVLFHAHVATSLVLTLVAPMWLLILGPLLLGVPHVASDLRYLLIRPPVRIRWRGLIAIPLVVMVALRAGAWAGLPWSPDVELGLGLGTAALVLCLTPLSAPHRAAGLASLVVVFLALVPDAHLTLLVFAHLHNGIAVALWLWLFAKDAAWPRVAAAASSFALAAALILTGAFDALWGAVPPIGGLSLEGMEAVMAPGVDGPLATRLVMLFAFAQSLHYAIWIRLVPQSLDARPVPPTFARSFTRLGRDFGRGGLAILATLAVGLPVLALVWDADGARIAYLVAVVFHGWLEIALLAALFTGGAGSLARRIEDPA